MSLPISVIIPSHNPNKLRLERTLHALKQQTLPIDQWELVLVDNATPDPNYVCGFDNGGYVILVMIKQKDSWLGEKVIESLLNIVTSFISSVAHDEECFSIEVYSTPETPLIYYVKISYMWDEEEEEEDIEEDTIDDDNEMNQPNVSNEKNAPKDVLR